MQCGLDIFMVEAILNGAPIPPAAGGPKPVTITLRKNGVMAKRVNPAADPFDRSQKSIIALMAMPAPTKPVAVGESWKTDIPNPLMKGKIITITSTLVGKDKVLGKDAILTTDAGNFAGWATRFLNFGEEQRYIGPTNGAMGYAVPAAIGAKITLAWDPDASIRVTED